METSIRRTQPRFNAISEPTPQQRLATKVKERTERVRVAMLQNADRGFHQRVCDAMGWRRERPSREQNGAEKLSVELVFADAALHIEEGRPDAATAILAAFQQTVCPVIRLRDGQYLLELEPGE